jgi:hypothetical protein
MKMWVPGGRGPASDPRAGGADDRPPAAVTIGSNDL